MRPITSRFLTRLRAGEEDFDNQRPELVIATSRAVLAIIALFAAYIDPTSPPYFTNVVRLLLATYALHSIAVWIRLRISGVSSGFTLILHLLDIIFPVAVSLFSGGPSSPFFLFVPFAIVWSAFRWGSVESLATASGSILLLLAQTLVLSSLNGIDGMRIETAEINRMLLRFVYLGILGAMLGMLGEREKEWRAEDAFINRILHGIHVERGMSETMHFVMRQFLQLYGGTRAVTVTEGLITQRFYQFEVHHDRPNEHPAFVELLSDKGDVRMIREKPYTFFTPGEHAQSRRHGTLAIDQNGHVNRSEIRTPAPLFAGDSSQSTLSVSFHFGNEWAGRLLLFGAQLGPKREDELRFAAKLMQSISPAVYSVYLVRRLRNRIGALERARVARELHDGAIQSLISIEMQVDVMRRKAKLDADLSADLGRIQHLLQKQVLEIRELMQQLRPTDITPQQFVDFLSNTVDRFRRDTGINANFQSDVQEVDLTPLQCRELGRILQEALVNVRKHSGASNVNVNLAPDDGWLLLTIDDDGKGFDFSGRMNSQQLTEAQIGPTIIKDRVRSIAGELEIESAPGQGARLRVALPRKGYR